MAKTDLLSKFEQFQTDVVLETSDHALSTLASMIGSGSVDLSPQFQRRDRWDAAKQSQLIESFILNIPVPPIYLAEGSRGRYDVIDGKQRLTAIQQFLSGDFVLRELSRFPQLSNRRFADLPPDIQGTLNFRPLRTVTLLRQSSPAAKYEVFHRLNSGGQVLNAQEIRNVLFRGPLNDLVYQLGEASFLRQQLKITSGRSPAYRNMTDAEWVLRFLTLQERWHEFSGDYRQSMDGFMAEHQEASENRLRTFRRSFTEALDACEEVFGSNAFKRPERGTWRDQALAGLYDAEMVAFAELDAPVRDRVISHGARAAAGLEQLFARDPAFEQATRQATNTPARVQYRITQLVEVFTAAAR